MLTESSSNRLRPGFLKESRPESHIAAGTIVALSQFWSNKRWPEGQSDTYVTGGDDGMSSPVRQRRRITHGLRVEVVEYYERGMSSRRVAATFGLGRTTVLEILNSAGVAMRPRGRKY